MNHRVRSVLAAVLIMVVSILLPSDFQFENTDRFVKEQSSSIQMTAQYTDGIEMKVIHDNNLRLFLIFSFVVCLNRVFFSCIQFYTLPFTRFLCEYDILLEKDGKNEILLSESKNMKY